MKLLLSLLFSGVTLAAFASDCQEDARRYCPDVDPGKGQLAKCLESVKSDLSQACVRELRAFEAATSSKNPCFKDLADFCTDVPSHPAKLEYCLMKNESRLSPRCSADLKKKKGNIIIKNVCAQDVVSHCYPAVTAPEGAINRCLIRNQAKLAPFCKKSVEQRLAEIRKRNPCYDDTEKLCPEKFTMIDIHLCLEKNLKGLSPVCKKVVTNEQEKAKANPCYLDLMRHCKPRISPSAQYRCLSVNAGELSNACTQYRKLEEEKISKMVEVCEADRLKLCPKVPFSEGKVVKCLQDNKKKVSAPCAKLL